MKKLHNIGWREWAALPDLGVSRIKVKIDTGARTSALDVEQIEPYIDDGVEMVRFELSTRKKIKSSRNIIEARVVDSRLVKDSGGTAQKRYVIETTLVLGEEHRLIELTLARRPKMRFPMLIGRTAIRDAYLVNPGKAYLLGEPIVKK